MQLSFVTITGNNNEGWDVTQKSFPGPNFEVVKKALTHTGGLISAAAEAKKIAQAFQLTCVPQDVGVVFIAPHFGFYIVKLLKPDDTVENISIKIEEKEQAENEARALALRGNHAFVCSDPIVIQIN